MSLRFERSHVNRESILYIRSGQSVVSLVDLLDGDDFYVGCDVMFAAKVEHLLRFCNTPDERAREGATLEQKGKGMRWRSEWQIPQKRISIWTSCSPGSRRGIVVGASGNFALAAE
jgi:hypothetical protein